MRKLLALTILMLLIGLTGAFSANLDFFNNGSNSTIDKQGSNNQLVQNTDTSYGFLSATTNIVLDNQKEATEQIDVQRKIPIFYMPFTHFEPEPAQKQQGLIQTEIQWNREIGAGETAQLSYRIDYWMPATILGILTAFLLFLRRKITRKSIVKSGKIDEGTLTVYLEVENNSRKAMENVEIRDFVPEMLEVGEQFDTLEPELEETDNGTRLHWSIDRMESKESRVLTYQIESDLEVKSEIVLREAELHEDGKKIEESSEVTAEFPAKQST